MQLKSQRYSSKYLNANKLKKLKKVNKSIKHLKNSISKFIYYHIQQLYYCNSIYTFSSKYSRKYRSKYLKVWNIQQIFQDICQLYLNMIKNNIQYKDFKVTKSIKKTYYKKSVIKHPKGSIKQFKLIKHNTNLTKLIKYLTYTDLNNLNIINPQLLTIYNYYISKYSKQRIHTLIKSIQQNILSNLHLIQFNTGTYRVPYSTNGKTIASQFIVDQSNKKYKYWFKIDLRDQNIYLPIQYNQKYHNINNIRNSQCSKCGYIDKDNRKDQEHFKCLNCGHELNADYNASLNILNRLQNVSLKYSKLHKLDQYNRLVSNTYNKNIIKCILDSIFIIE